MRWRSLALVAVIASLPMGLVGKAWALTAGESACCTIMSEQAAKYFKKHVKVVDKCTSKMDASSNPNSEKCDDGFDSVVGGTDFVIDKFGGKFFKKIKKKCAKKMGTTIDPLTPALAGCGCPTETFLEDQINCLLEKNAGPADCGVCDITPKLKNANRANSAPPGLANYCNTNCSP